MVALKKTNKFAFVGGFVRFLFQVFFCLKRDPFRYSIEFFFWVSSGPPLSI